MKVVGRFALLFVLVIFGAAAGIWLAWPDPPRQPPRLAWEQSADSLDAVKGLHYELRLRTETRMIQPECSQTTAGFTCQVPLDPIPASPFELCAFDGTSTACARFDPSKR